MDKVTGWLQASNQLVTRFMRHRSKNPVTKTESFLQVTVSFENDKTTFTRMGSFRQMTLTEKMADPQAAVVPETVPATSKAGS